MDDGRERISLLEPTFTKRLRKVGSEGRDVGPEQIGKRWVGRRSAILASLSGPISLDTANQEEPLFPRLGTQKAQRDVRVHPIVFGEVLDILEQADHNQISHVGRGINEQALNLVKKRCDAVEVAHRHSSDNPPGQSRNVVVLT
jgi:hypothetical protein